ncbi:ABC transporter permease [Candidatus Sumerlaeota bacterium]|nr:ABC transporter permease [Candidatus Sumerlaeota bacterium]
MTEALTTAWEWITRAHGHLLIVDQVVIALAVVAFLARHRIRRWLQSHEAISRGFSSPFVRALLALGLIMLLGCRFNADGAFFHWSTHRDMFRSYSFFGILACGMTVVILTAGIDLSVGSILGFVGVVFAHMAIRWQWSGWLAIPLCLAIGAALGAVSGALIARFRMQPFIATLAMMVFARGLARYVTSNYKIGRNVILPDNTPFRYPNPPVFDLLDSKILWDNVHFSTLVMLGCFALTWILLTRLRVGRHIYAIGGNEEAARLSGVPTAAVKVFVYALCGLFCAVAGICFTGQATQGDPDAGFTYELTAIAMVVIGGTSLMGGRGGIGLTFLGVLIFGYLDKILSINGQGTEIRFMFTGLIIVIAVLLQRGEK